MRNPFKRLTNRWTLVCLTLMLALPTPLMAQNTTTNNNNKMPNIKPWWDNPLINKYIAPWAGLFLAVIVVVCFGGFFVMAVRAVNAFSKGRAAGTNVIAALMFIAIAGFALAGLSSVNSFGWLFGR